MGEQDEIEVVGGREGRQVQDLGGGSEGSAGLQSHQSISHRVGFIVLDQASLEGALVQ